MRIHFKAVTVLLTIVVFTGCSFFKADEERTTEISEYDKYFSEEGSHNNDIFPKELVSSAEVEDFQYYYYNPFDPNYVSYLVYKCNDDDYSSEVVRLSELNSADDYLIYGATGFNYPVLAVYVDEYYGYTYALGDEANNRMIYVELYYCNYFSDIEYNDIIALKYLPIGYDAKPQNETRKKYDEGKL